MQGRERNQCRQKLDKLLADILNVSEHFGLQGCAVQTILGYTGESMPSIENISENKDIVDSINKILTDNGVSLNINISDITITKEIVSDLAKENPKLSNAISNYLWPFFKNKTVYHYTSKSAAESILGTQVFRLNNIKNRFNEGEISTFCKTHELNGYLEPDENNDPEYKNLIMPNTFYASFTDTVIKKEKEEYFWRTFAANDGVRLKIEISASNENFRKIYYEKTEGDPIKILYDLKSIIKNYNRKFILKGISRFCSFYLPGQHYRIEDEYRILHRIWNEHENEIKHDGEHTYIELPINGDEKWGYELKIVEVHANEKPNMPDSYVFSKRVA